MLLALLHSNGTHDFGVWFSIIQKLNSHQVICQNKQTLLLSCILASIFHSLSVDMLTDCPALSSSNTLVSPFLKWRHHFLTAWTDITSGPQLRPIDKGDKEVIKFCRLWQASDKAMLVTDMSTPLKVSTKKWEYYKSDKIFRACAVYISLPFVTILVVIRISYVTLLCHPCRWVVIEALNHMWLLDVCEFCQADYRRLMRSLRDTKNMQGTRKSREKRCARDNAKIDYICSVIRLFSCTIKFYHLSREKIPLSRA